MNNRMHKDVVSLITTFLAIIFFFTVIFITPFPKATYREPNYGYASLKEEYIAAIDSFLMNGGQVVFLPENSTFIIDKNGTITVKDCDTNAKVTCTFLLDYTVPIYKWSYINYKGIFLYILFIIIVFILTLILGFAIKTIIDFIFNIYNFKKTKKKSFNTLKHKHKNSYTHAQ